MKRTTVNSTIAILAVMAAFYAQRCAGAQSTADGVVALTTGAWHQDGAEANHADVFKADGNFIYGSVDTGGAFTEFQGYGGMWLVTGTTVELNYWQWPTRRDIYYLPINGAGTRGVDENGHAISMKRIETAVAIQAAPAGRKRKVAAAAASPITAETQERAAEAVKTYRESIVFVTGSAGAGSGFIATAGKSNYLVTNVHVAAEIADAAFQGLDGAVIHGGAPSMAVGEDLFRMEYRGGGRRFKIMEDVETGASIGDEVVVLGNAEGAGVVNTLIGKIVGIGPNLVEVDAPFVPGNSGSPIIHLKSGKVIGVATYARFDGFEAGGSGIFGGIKVRRFGYRLDTVKKWEPVEWAKFKAQADRVDEIQKRTYELGEALMSMESNGGKPAPDGAPDINKALADWRTMKAKKGKWIQKEAANERLAAFLKSACEADVTAAQSTVTYDYFKRELTMEKSERDQMEAAIWPAIKEMLI